MSSPKNVRRAVTRLVFPATLTVVAGILAACGGAERQSAAASSATSLSAAEHVDGAPLVLGDTVVTTNFEAAGIAEPMRQATLSTKLMGTVTDVLVHEGDTVNAGQTLVQLDAREMQAKSSQVAASIADAEAMQKEAAVGAARFRALYADSAATRAQFDASQTALARADAAVRAARAAAGEIEAAASYSTIRAPFRGVITARLVDQGAFAAPGAPLITVQDVSVLRIRAAISADANRRLARGQRLSAIIDGDSATAIVEGVVPTASGNVFTVNATVANPRARLRAGSAATLLVPTGTAHMILVPIAAIVREGDLTGVVVRTARRDERRWVKLGATHGVTVEVSSGLQAGESIVIPSAVASKAAGT